MTRKIVTGDCETDPFKFGRIPKPFIWCIFDGEVYHTFKTAKEMVEFLKDKEWIVYFHNGGKFDYFFMLEYLEPFDFIMDINGRLAKFKIGLCEFRDSYNIIPQPLAAYKKDEFDYTKLEANVRQKHWKEIMHYLHNDCLFLYEIVSVFVEEYGMNLTLAAAAFKYFNKEFNPEENQKTDKIFYDDFAPFYYGGRVECFKKGLIPHKVNCYDIKSAYPTAMCLEHPYGDTYDVLECLPKTGIEQCFIELECISYGAFPFRSKGESLAFPNDEKRRIYKVTGWEYLAAKECNDIYDVKIINVYRFHQTITFKPYIKHFYSMKEKAKKETPEYVISKLFLNSLYGKYAANPARYCETYICPMDYIQMSCEALDMEYAGTLGKWAVLESPLPEEKQNYYNVATAASITGWVRAYLYKSMKKCKGVVYCDTDSIFCKEANLNFDGKLGAWDLEGEFKAGGGIGGKKLYAFEYIKPIKDKKTGKVLKTHKQASKGARLTAKEILRVCQGEIIKYKAIAPSFSLKREVFFLEREIRMT